MKLIDANIIIRYLANDDKKQTKGCRTLFARLQSGQEHVELTLPVLFEVIYVLNRIYKISRIEIYKAISIILDLKTINIQGKSVLKKSIEYWSARNIDLTDCYLAALLENCKEPEIYSFDKDFDKLNFLTRIEPN
ncbi:MAG: PIN domain-containing protein [Deltaproteobacteria bacterium]|nr:PIN domain-containing protein [Deltaproteobacteria bacterium]